jgi:alpha,alpha-trehalase
MLRSKGFAAAILMMLSGACSHQVEQQNTSDYYTSELFREVQLQAIFPDSKTFVDCIPKRPLDVILKDYEKQKSSPGFNLRKFVEENYTLPDRPKTDFVSDQALSMEGHLQKLWPVLTRKADQYNPNSSLLPLPNPYIVPGGRFSEIYYWDSYFTMLGLRVQGHEDLIVNMLNNFAFLADSVGFIPNGNRNYYLSRSQPPFFSLMVKLLAEKDPEALTRYLPSLVKEYAFWMNGEEKLSTPGDTFEHVVMLSDGSVLNRYYDKRAAPRPEAYKEDVATAHEAGSHPEFSRNPAEVYKALRSAAESGWDFSSRWFADEKQLASIQTTDLVPVDLNCLLYHLELMIHDGFKQKGEEERAAEMKKRADTRRKALLTFCWDAEQGFFFDYHIRKEHRTSSKTLAAVYPLFFKMVQPEMADAVATVIKKEFLKPGGLTTTLVVSGEQWDAPNGWAPLQWMGYRGLKNYGHHELAADIKHRWLRQNLRVFQATGKMMEKYNVLDTTLVAGGGEYPNQDGFGWTNGVALALMADSQ